MWPIVGRGFDRALSIAQRRRFPAYLRLFKAMQTWPRERVVSWQRERLRGILEHAHANVPYYREVIDQSGLKPADLAQPGGLAALPFLTKDIINERLDELVSRVGDRPRATVKSSGGSTGHNVRFLIERETHDRRRAAGRLTESWDGVAPGTRVGALWSSPIDENPSFGARLYDRMTNTLYLSAFGVDDATLLERFEALRRHRPEVLLSYPSTLAHLAPKLGRERCRALGLRVIYTTAEALLDPVRAEIEELFGCPIRNRYGSREFGLMASDAPDRHGLYFMDMRLYPEIVDDDATPSEGGGELVVTDLDNRIMPFIRYRIGDRVRRLDSAPEGHPWTRLAAIEGRVMDLVVLKDGRCFGGTYFTLTLRPKDGSVRHFQVVQESLERLVVRIVPGPSYDASARARLLERVTRGLGDAIHVELVEVDEIPVLASGKRRLVVVEAAAREALAAAP